MKTLTIDEQHNPTAPGTLPEACHL